MFWIGGGASDSAPYTLYASGCVGPSLPGYAALKDDLSTKDLLYLEGG